MPAACVEERSTRLDGRQDPTASRADAGFQWPEGALVCLPCVPPDFVFNHPKALASNAYKPNTISRASVGWWFAGQPVFTLVDPNGNTWTHVVCDVVHRSLEKVQSHQGGFTALPGNRDFRCSL